jgi:hypothetical protein
VPDDELISRALSLAESMAEHSAAALTAAKSVMNTAWAEGTGLPIALRLERERAALYCLTLPDSMAGLRRFSSRHDRRRGSSAPQPDQPDPKMDSPRHSPPADAFAGSVADRTEILTLEPAPMRGSPTLKSTEAPDPRWSQTEKQVLSTS